jgi:hypothetical protein
LIVAALLVVNNLVVEWNRDLVVFIIALFATPLVLIVAFAILMGTLPFETRWKRFLVAMALVGGSIVATTTVGRRLHDPTMAILWMLANPTKLHRALGHDGIATFLDGWGFAGLENESYLVVDRTDSLNSSPAAAAGWRRKLGLGCEIIEPQRVWSKLYVVITYNCSLGPNVAA